MDLGLQDQVAFVSGSSRGIGRAIAVAFLQEGARVVLTGRNSEALNRTNGELSDTYGSDRVHAICCDLTDGASIKRACGIVEEAFGRIDILVANVGRGSGKPFLESTLGDWQDSLMDNCLSALQLVHFIVPNMKARGSGVILLISSIVAVEALAAPIEYSAAKSALNSVGKNLARLLAPDNIRVNTLMPGNILFPGGSWDTKLKASRDWVESYLQQEVPMKRFGNAEEVADIAVFMCSKRATFMAGSAVVVDGAQSRAY